MSTRVYYRVLTGWGLLGYRDLVAEGNAGGKAIGRFEAALGVVGLLALATTYILLTGWNPWPGITDWLERTGSLSDPETSWTVRLEARPEYAVVAGDAVVVLMRGAVEARDTRTGQAIWARKVPWAAVAGQDATAVVATGRPGQRGYEVVDAETGTILWTDTEAVGVWTYREALLALTCKSLSECTLAAREPSRGTVLWSTPLTGLGKLLSGVNHELLGTRALAPDAMDARVAFPAELPAMLGFPLDGKIQVIDTETGRRVREAEASGATRVVVAGGRLLYSTAQRRDGQCRYTLEARDPVSGALVWRKDGYDLRTASGAGCEQRRDPTGGGGTLAAIRGDNREVLLDAADGRELWVGENGERVLSTDGRTAIIRAANGRTLKSVDLGDRRTLWRRDVTPEADALITRHAVIIIDEGRIVAAEVGTGRTVADATTDADVVGVGANGVVLGAGRQVGLLPYGSIRR